MTAAPIIAPHNGTTDAWAFVLRHRSTIAGFCRRWLGPLPEQDREDATANAILRIVEKHHTLRLDGATKNPKGLISTWIGFQVRASLTTARRARRKQEREGVGRLVEVGGAVAVGSGRTNSEGEVTGRPVPGPEAAEPDRRLLDADLLSQIESFWFVANPRQRAAIRSHLDSDNARAAKARGFNTLRERDATLRALANRAEA